MMLNMVAVLSKRKNLVVIQLLSLLIFTACGQELDSFLGRTGTDFSGATVVDVKTKDSMIREGTVFEITFSEDLATERLLKEEDFFVLVDSQEVDDSFLLDVRSTPLSSFNKDDTILTEVKIIDAQHIQVVVKQALVHDIAYTLLVSEDVRDLRGNPLLGDSGKKGSAQFAFKSTKSAPVVIGTNAFGELLPNQKYLWFEFASPVVNFTKDRLSISRENGEKLVIERIELSSDRQFAQIVLQDVAGRCERLFANEKYTLEIDGEIKNDQNLKTDRIQKFSWRTVGTCDIDPMNIEDLKVSYIAAETDATEQDYRFRVSFSADRIVQSQLFYGKFGEEKSCLSQNCPYVIPISASNSSQSDAAYEISIKADLTLGQRYDLLLVLEDLRGVRQEFTLDFELGKTAAVVLNEWLANPIGDDSVGEFIELYNQGKTGAAAVDLSGFQIQVDDNSKCTFDQTAPTLESGEYLLVVSSKFDPFQYSGIPFDRLYFPDCSVSSLSLGNSPQSLTLFNADQDPISNYAGYQALDPGDNEGMSIERNARFAPDEEQSFVFNMSTPGTENISWASE